ncbi:MAG: creatininase family protein [Pseudomonadota bacterium]
MRLDLCTWPEVEAYLARASGILIPVGSTEQHGPMGLIGTDSLCATAIAEAAAARTGALIAPTLALTPAPFNAGFPGTLSLSEPVFEAVLAELFEGLLAQGFGHLYCLNAHGANLAPLARAAAGRPAIRIRSWWDFAPVNALRRDLYGGWEGMHATPSEVAITQALCRSVAPGAAATPPEPVSAAFIAAHAGDRHGPPDAHRRAFPDGRVGSHSALARPEHGRALLAAAGAAVAEDYRRFVRSS